MNYSQALQWLNGSIRHAVVQPYPAQRGLDRTRALLTKLGNPQEQIPIIHVAGTSGKGSTTTMIAALLVGQGFRTGLSLSPSVFDLRERFQLDGRLPSKKLVANALSVVRAKVEELADTPSYFEVLTATAFWLFAHEGCQYAVVETGMGGTFDATNVIDQPNKLAVITRIGLDHRHILGQTEGAITSHKAGIIQPNNQVVALSQTTEINGVIAARASFTQAALELVDAAKAVTRASVTLGGTDFAYEADAKTQLLHLGVLGRHQVENAMLALSAIQTLARRDGWSVNWTSARSALQTLRFPGRLDLYPIDGRCVIADGAHNPQKIRALLEALRELFPSERLTFLIGFKQGKQAREMVELIAPWADRLILTDFQQGADLPVRSIGQQGVAQLQAHVPAIEYIPNYRVALTEALLNPGPIVMTGSLYLCASLYTALQAFKRGS